MPPPAKPVVIGDSGVPFGSNLVALPCHRASRACHPIVKLSPTHRLPSLSNIALPPARYPPPSNLSGSTQALGGNVKYGMKGTARMVLPGGTGYRSSNAKTRSGRYHGKRAIDSAAVSVSLGAPPFGGVAAAKSLLQASGVTRVTQAASAFASVAKFAIVGVWPPLSGSWITRPQRPV